MGYATCGPDECGPSGGYVVWRRYLTKDERVAKLQDYAASLENELKAVKERIEAIKSD